MNEDFLQYLWKYKKFNFLDLKTTDQKEIILKQVGEQNQSQSGPDFFNAQLVIDHQRWAGNVEIHLKSSDWYIHQHEIDSSYDNVILHVVWEDDVEVFRKNNTRIPTLKLKDYVDKKLIDTYQNFFQKTSKKWISCENNIENVDSFTISHWQERLYLERLEEKSVLIKEILQNSANNWEATFFKLLAKNFGLNVNNEAFLSLAESIDFSIVRKCSHNLPTIEALFFGQSGLLDIDAEEKYVRDLKQEYHFLQNKFSLNNQGVLPFQFFRLRPPNFPTIRISQLANLYHRTPQLFSRVIAASTLEEFYVIFEVETTNFWRNHYTFTKESPSRKKRLTKSFIHLIIINTILPLKFLFAKSNATNAEDELLKIMSQLPAEKNTIVSKYTKLGVTVSDAMHSQAMIRLKKTYCDQNACLSCAIGNYLLNKAHSLG